MFKRSKTIFYTAYNEPRGQPVDPDFILISYAI